MRQLRTRAFHEESGYNLIEISIVLAIVGIVVASIWVVASNVSENARQYKFGQQQQLIVQNIRQIYQRSSAFVGLSNVTATLDQQAAFPKEMRYNHPSSDAAADGILNHPWSTLSTGTVTVFKRSATQFGIRYARIPKTACANISAKFSGPETGTQELVINGNSITTFPVSMGTALTNCTSSTNNILEWRFGIRE